MDFSTRGHGTFEAGAGDMAESYGVSISGSALLLGTGLISLMALRPKP
jgi:hypothetical protein